MTNFKRIALKAERLDGFVSSLLDEIKSCRQNADDCYNERDPENWENSWDKMRYDDYLNRADAYEELVNEIGHLKL